MTQFSYDIAFSRNLGWLTPAEQAVLRGKRVAIAGLGGVGGAHLLTLARLGVGSFHIADFDRFDLANFNRQAGASVSTLGRPKSKVLGEMALDINPELVLRSFDHGVDPSNLDAFLDGVDLYIDGLDFFAFAARESTFRACRQRAIPAVTAAPLGMGAAVLTFMPRGMSFDAYFRWDLAATEEDKALRFALGLAPAGLHRKYLLDLSSIDLAAQRGPSTVIACQLCAGVAAAEALKLLLGRGDVVVAPRGVQYDAYRNRIAYTWRPWGNANPWQRLALAVARRQLTRAKAAGVGSFPAETR